VVVAEEARLVRERKAGTQGPSVNQVKMAIHSDSCIPAGVAARCKVTAGELARPPSPRAPAGAAEESETGELECRSSVLPGVAGRSASEAAEVGEARRMYNM